MAIENQNYRDYVTVDKQDWDEDKIIFNEAFFDDIMDSYKHLGLDTIELDWTIREKIQDFNDMIDSLVDIWIIDRWEVELSESDTDEFVKLKVKTLNDLLNIYVLNTNEHSKNIEKNLANLTNPSDLKKELELVVKNKKLKIAKGFLNFVADNNTAAQVIKKYNNKVD